VCILSHPSGRASPALLPEKFWPRGARAQARVRAFRSQVPGRWAIDCAIS
jgi:hypothetical protein